MNGISAVIAGVVAFAFPFVVAYTGAELVDPPPRQLLVFELSYADGIVTQRVGPAYGDAIPADWAARITRPGAKHDQLLCAGKGDAPGLYSGQVSRWTVDEWAGDDCPDLQPGDKLKAVWEYRNSDGQLTSVSRTIEVE